MESGYDANPDTENLRPPYGLSSWRTTRVVKGAEACPPVCTENLIRIDCVTESPNVNGDDRVIVTNEAIMRASSGSFLARTPLALANCRSLNGLTWRTGMLAASRARMAPRS